MPPVTLAPVGHDEVEAVQAIIESDPGYTERVTGLLPGPADGSSLLMVRPPGVPETNKVVLGVRVDGELVGLIDLLRGYPEPDVAYLGLLQVNADRQRQGIGRAAHTAVLDWLIAWPEISRIRLAVVETNRDVADPFWRSLGYTPVGEPVPYRSNHLETTAQRYERRRETGEAP